MKVTRLYTGDDGKSHLEVITMPPSGDDRFPINVKEIIFRRSPSGSIFAANAPFRHFDFTISGRWTIDLKDGTVEEFGPGDVVLAEDLTGPGHISTVVSDEPRIFILAPITDK